MELGVSGTSEETRGDKAPLRVMAALTLSLKNEKLPG